MQFTSGLLIHGIISLPFATTYTVQLHGSKGSVTLRRIAPTYADMRNLASTLVYAE